MNCAYCGASNKPTARFCRKCGTPAAERCLTCEAELDVDDVFCSSCGAAIAAAGPVAESTGVTDGAVRKTVTVVFADLGGSTGFGERVDPETSRAVMAQYHAILQEVIDAHRGTVAKFMGDGMMALFGVPDIAEDDAVRAVRAGIDAQRRFESFAAEIAQRYGETLRLRVGVNTGEVVIAESDADLIGDALNVAARLEKACTPGRVLVGEETWRLTRNEVGFESLGEVTVAGRVQPVAIYEVASAAAANAENVAPFVGRVNEMQRLRAEFDRATAQLLAQLVTVLGSPGVGKTRLSREFAALVAHERDARSFEIRCDRAGDETFAPIAQMIREAAALDDDATAEVVRERISALLVADLADRAGITDILAGVYGAASARSVEETFWAIRRLTESLAATRPLVIVIDDIQWAEPKLLDLLEHLSEWIDGAAVMLLCLARPELRDVRPGLAEINRRVADVVLLDGLDRAATEQLAAGLLGAERLPAGLIERLPSSTDGNPLFVRELVRMLVDDAVIERRADGEWALTIDADAVEVPPTIQSLLAARVERLPSDERLVLELASVIGAEFSLGAVRDLVRASVPVPSLLESMRRKELVEPTGTYWGDEPMYRFHHVLIRDAAYRRLLKASRAELHQRVGEWTDAAAASLIGDHDAAIAYHFEQAYQYRGELGPHDAETERLGARAAELLTAAAQRALGRDDLSSAGALASRALVVLPAFDTSRRADLLLVACECLLASGDVSASGPLVEQLRAAGATDDGLQAWATCFEAQLVGLTDPDGLLGAEQRASAAAQVFQRLDDGAGEAKAQQVRAGLLARLGRVGEAESVLDLALGAARAADDRRRVTAVLGAAPAAALFGPSPVARAGGRCLDVVRLLRITTASPSVEATSMRCQAVLEALRGRFDVSRSMLASARATLEELGLRHGLLETDLFTGMVEFVAGDFDAAIAPLRSAYEGLGSLGVGADAGQAAALLARVLIEHGDVPEADQMAAASEQLAGQNLKTSIAWRIARAEVLAARGLVTEGIEFARAAVDIAQRTDLVLDHADACAALANLLELAGDADGSSAARHEAVRLYEAKGAVVPAQRLTVDSRSSPTTADARAEVETRVPRSSRSSRGDRTPRGPTPNLVNSAARVTGRLGAMSGRWSEVPEIFADDVTVHDRRRLVGGELEHGRAAVIALDRSFGSVGIDEARGLTLAVRGDRLSLHRAIVRTADSFEIRFLMLVELNEQGFIASIVYLDEDDLAAALAELDTRYVAGEGSVHVEVLTALARVSRATVRGRESFAAVASPDFVSVDHSQLGWPTTDRDGYGSIQTGYNEVIDRSFIVTAMECEQRAVLITTKITGADAAGSQFEWLFHIVWQFDAVGQATRAEHFPEDSYVQARTRLDELGAATPPTSPFTPDNLATKWNADLLRLWESTYPDFVRWCKTSCAEHIVRVDHRRGVAGPDVRGPEEYGRALAATLEMFDRVRVEVLEVGGQYVGLSRHTYESAGFEMTLLSLTETDSHGRLVRIDLFDEDDLVLAHDTMFEQFLAREGPAQRFQSLVEFRRALARNDFDAALDCLAPDFAPVDHQRFSMPAGDRDAFIEAIRIGRGLTSGTVVTGSGFRTAGSAVIGTSVRRAAILGGGVNEWSSLLVSAVDADGKLRCLEYFEPDDWAAARARFEELAAEGSEVDEPVREALPIGNAGTRAVEEMGRRLWSGQWGDLAAMLDPDLVVDDMRSITSSGTGMGRSDFLEVLRSFVAMGFTEQTNTPIACRGDRLSAVRFQVRNDTGDEIGFLGVGEVDGRGLITAITFLDENAVTAAMQLLDERYLASLDPESAYTALRGLDFRDAWSAGNVEAVNALVSADWIVTDHREMGNGTADLDQGRTLLQARADSAAQNRIVALSLDVRGHVSLLRALLVSTTSDGSTYEIEMLSVVRLSGGLLTLHEYFDVRDSERARARYEELAREQRTPAIDNAAVRVRERSGWLGQYGSLQESIELLSPDIVHKDFRTTVSAPTLYGRDAYIENQIAILSLNMRLLQIEPVAVRGERLMLGRVHWDADGFTVVHLATFELDEHGLIVANDVFDEDDITRALDYLDARYAEIRTEPETPIGRAFVSMASHFNHREWPSMYELLAPEFVGVDHSPIGFGSGGGRDGYVAVMRSQVDVAPGATAIVGKTYEQGTVGLAVIEVHGTTAEGSQYSWHYHQVFTVTTEGLVARLEAFSETQWPEALARFDELCGAEGGGEPRTVEQLLDNTATHCNDAVVAAVKSLHEVGVLSSGEVVAVRGDRLALVRQVWERDGFEVPMLVVAECDESGVLVAWECFDGDDYGGAFAELERRFIEGEGAPDEYILLRDCDLGGVLEAWEAFRAVWSPDARVVNHRRIGWPMVSVDDVIDRRRADDGIVTRLRSITPWRRVRGDVTIAVFEDHLVTPEGSAYSSVTVMIARWSFGLIDSAEFYDLEDFETAYARFEELAAEPKPDVPDNAVVRLITRAQWLGEYGSGRERSRYLRAMWTDYIEYRDLRKGVSGEPIIGRDAINQSIVETRKVFDRIVETPIAVHGEGRALFKLSWVSNNGFESSMWSLHEANEAGSIFRTTIFDEMDFATASAALEAD